MDQANRFGRAGLAAVLLAMPALGGCHALEAWFGKARVAERTETIKPVPEPLGLLLPKAIHIHPFTGMRVFDEAGGITGLDVRIEAIDGCGDANKAFGDFRFELFRYKPNSPDPKGERVGVWSESVADPKSNREHWINVQRTYQFKLAWGEAIPIGEKFVLLAVFESDFTPRLFDERTFVAGQ